MNARDILILFAAQQIERHVDIEELRMKVNRHRPELAFSYQGRGLLFIEGDKAGRDGRHLPFLGAQYDHAFQHEQKHEHPALKRHVFAVFRTDAPYFGRAARINAPNGFHVQCPHPRSPT